MLSSAILEPVVFSFGFEFGEWPIAADVVVRSHDCRENMSPSIQLSSHPSIHPAFGQIALFQRSSHAVYDVSKNKTHTEPYFLESDAVRPGREISPMDRWALKEKSVRGDTDLECEEDRWKSGGKHIKLPIASFVHLFFARKKFVQFLFFCSFEGSKKKSARDSQGLNIPTACLEDF